MACLYGNVTMLNDGMLPRHMIIGLQAEWIPMLDDGQQY